MVSDKELGVSDGMATRLNIPDAMHFAPKK